MKLDLLLPVLLLESFKVLTLDEQSLSVSKSGKFKSKQLLKAWNLADIHNDWLSLGNLVLWDDTVDETVRQGFFCSKSMLQKDHFCSLSATKDLWELD